MREAYRSISLVRYVRMDLAQSSNETWMGAWRGTDQDGPTASVPYVRGRIRPSVASVVRPSVRSGRCVAARARVRVTYVRQGPRVHPSVVDVI